MNDQRLLGAVGLLANNENKLQNALNGVDSRHTMVRPRGVVKVQHVLALVGLQREELG